MSKTLHLVESVKELHKLSKEDETVFTYEELEELRDLYPEVVWTNSDEFYYLTEAE